jgi:negative regulator of sigma-B (phosphoserine phosphatase)
MSTSQRRSNRPPKLVGNENPPALWSCETGSPDVVVAWHTRPRVGESANGDAVVVRKPGDSVLIALVDALGHGPRAAEVADAATAYFSAEPQPKVPVLVQGVHEALHGTRGAAALILVISPAGLEVCSVGNVELRSTNTKLPFVLTPGVFGVRLRKPRICTSAPISDRLVVFSDGISGRFDLKAITTHTPAEAATHIFASHRHSHDDATVVVIDVNWTAGT